MTENLALTSISNGIGRDEAPNESIRSGVFRLTIDRDRDMWCSALSLLFIVVLTNPGQANSEQSLPLLLLVSFDGFRHDYPSLHGPLKNFRRLAENGVRATQLTPSFVTATFPNHYR